MENNNPFYFGTPNVKKVEEEYEGSSGFNCIACADMDRDGKIDLIVGDFGDERIDILYNNGKGKFSFGPNIEVEHVDVRNSIVMVKDVNHDNWQDIIYKGDDGNYYLTLNQGLRK